MPHLEVDDDIKEKYDQIFFLVQKKGENHIYPSENSPFEDPVPPKNTIVVYSSEYFEMYEYIKEGD